MFSNTLTPSLAASTLKAIDILDNEPDRQDKLTANALYFRTKLSELGFVLAGEGHPIIPIMIGDAKKASQMAQMLMKQGIYVSAFSFPVVPKGKARIRTQLSSTFSTKQLDKAIDIFAKTAKELGIIA